MDAGARTREETKALILKPRRQEDRNPSFSFPTAHHSLTVDQTHVETNQQGNLRNTGCRYWPIIQRAGNVSRTSKQMPCIGPHCFKHEILHS